MFIFSVGQSIHDQSKMVQDLLLASQSAPGLIEVSKNGVLIMNDCCECEKCRMMWL